MQLLTWLTVIYAGVLVGALALALISIATLLAWTSVMLRDARLALAAVRDHTAPLGPQFGAVKNGVDTIRPAIASAREHVDRSGKRLAAAAERAGLLARS